MGIAKTTLFDTELQTNAELYKALGHPARLAISKDLAETKKCITGDFADELPLSRTTVNQHLNELKELGLIISHTEGVKTYYRLNQDRICELKKLSHGLFDAISLSEAFICKP